MERYIRYELIGFNNITINENYKFELDTKLFKTIFISNDVKHLTVELQDQITLEEHRNEILVFLNHVCFNLIIQTEADINSPKRNLEIIEDGSKKILNDHMQLKDSIKFIRETSAENFYKKIVNSPTAMEKHLLLYERIFKTLHNPNKVVQFLSLYEFLMELLSRGKKHNEQRHVVEYMQRNKALYPFVSFKQTRRPGKSFEEDNFTYLRNTLSHCEETNDLNEHKKLGLQITDNIIRYLTIVLNDVILGL